jgi:hypothetical protein
MNNARVADDIVQRVRAYIVNAPVTSPSEPVGIILKDLIQILDCLERLAILERHIYNLASDAYEMPEPRKGEKNVRT